MAWCKPRRSSSSRSSSSSRYRRPSGISTDQDRTRSVHQSALWVHVAVEFEAKQDEAKPLCEVLMEFERSFGARRSDAVTERHGVRVQLLECGLSKWQDFVELQRVLAVLKRPMDGGEQLQLMVKTLLSQKANSNEWTLSLSFARAFEDALWRIASSLMLRLKSCGVMAQVVLPTKQLTLLLESAFVECERMEIDKYQWEGKLVWGQVVLAKVSEQREVIQRVFLSPIQEVVTAARPTLEDLRYPELVTFMDGVLSSSADSGKAVVVILRGIPGSGKSTIRREMKAICNHKGVALTACSADFFFETQRGYVFDARKLKDAHGKCKADFTKAITDFVSRKSEGGRCHQHVVLVDNTSTQRWEYEPYVDVARTHGSRVHIIEMKCPDVLTAFRMGRRNSHGVHPDKVVGMFLRWEEDQRAHCLTPQFEHPTLSANPLSDGDVGGLTYLGLFLDAASQKKLTAQIHTVYSNKYADHVTLFYRPNKQYVRDAEVGAPFTVRGVEVVQDERGQTLRVELDERLPLQVKNETPHITMSTKAGVRPSYSNDLLDRSTAKRTTIDPPIDLRARVGAVLHIQNQEVIMTTSPFAVDAASADTGHLRPPNEDCVSAANSELFILHVRECDLANAADDVTTKLLKRAQILHQMGSECKARRLLCVHEFQASSPLPVSSLLNKVQAHYRFSTAQIFDDVVVIPQPFSFEGFEEALNKFLDVADLGLMKQLTVLTTVEESMRWPPCTMKFGQNVAVSVLRTIVALENGGMWYDTACSTLYSMLDLLSINIEEQTRSVVLRGIDSVSDAWDRVLGAKTNHLLQRVDTTLVGLSTSVVDLCLVLPSGTSLDEVPTLWMKLLSELDGARSVRHAVGGSSIPGLIYFSLYTASSYTPTFCVRMTTRSTECGSAVDTTTVAQLELCEHQLRTSHEICDVEAYSVLTALLRAILSSRCSRLLPSKCQLSSLVNLTSERLILHYVSTIDSFDGVDAMPTAADVMSGRIVFALYRILTFFSKLTSDEWASAFGTSLQDLQGNKKARTAWIQALEHLVQSCTVIMASHHCVGTSLNPLDHVRVLGALIRADVDYPFGASGVRASVEVSSHLEWSPVHTHALCDKLRHAATMGSQDDNGTDVVSCVPSLVARHVDVRASSLEELRHIMTEIHALEATGHDGDEAFASDYKYVIV